MNKPKIEEIHEWCEESANLTEKWAAESDDITIKVVLNRVSDACCDVQDALEEIMSPRRI